MLGTRITIDRCFPQLVMYGLEKTPKKNVCKNVSRLNCSLHQPLLSISQRPQTTKRRIFLFSFVVVFQNQNPAQEQRVLVSPLHGGVSAVAAHGWIPATWERHSEFLGPFTGSPFSTTQAAAVALTQPSTLKPSRRPFSLRLARDRRRSNGASSPLATFRTLSSCCNVLVVGNGAP